MGRRLLERQLQAGAQGRLRLDLRTMPPARDPRWIVCQQGQYRHLGRALPLRYRRALFRQWLSSRSGFAVAGRDLFSPSELPRTSSLAKLAQLSELENIEV